jgi:small subunit ribosomal protein S21
VGIKGDEEIMHIDVRNNNIEQAMRVLKKKLQNEGFFNELRKREFHESKGEKERRKRSAGKRRAYKTLEKRKLEQGY